MAVDVRLYGLVDPERAGALALDALARAIVAGGATLVQLRDKKAGTRRLIEEARAIKAALQSSGVPLLVNDRVDVALAAAADGVHLGQDDMRPDDARALLGSHAIVGWTVRSQDEADAARLDLLDYVAVGGVFATASKDNAAAPIGLAGLRAIAGSLKARAPHMPVVAIAGIDRTNAADVIAAGADGVAVISALALAGDPAAAARDLRAVVERALARRGAG